MRHVYPTHRESVAHSVVHVGADFKGRGGVDAVTAIARVYTEQRWRQDCLFHLCVRTRHKMYAQTVAHTSRHAQHRISQSDVPHRMSPTHAQRPTALPYAMPHTSTHYYTASHLTTPTTRTTQRHATQTHVHIHTHTLTTATYFVETVDGNGRHAV